MQYKIHTSATITDRIQPSYNLRQTRLKFFSPPPNKFQGLENGAFWVLRGFILGHGVEWALLFHSILPKIVVNITLRWVYEEKNTCRSSNEHWLEAKTG